VNDRISAPGVVLVVGAFVFAALPHLGAMPPVLIAAVLLAAAWRVAVAMYGRGRPNRWIRLALTFGGLALVVLHFGTFWGRQAATVLLCVMMAAKLSEMFRLRDARVVAVLCYFLITTQFLFSQQLLLFVYLVVGCWLATAALLRLQRDADAPPGGAPEPAVRTSLRAGTVMLLLAAPFAVVLFVAFPRLGSPLWGVPEEALDARTGLSDEMSPGSIADLYIDDSPAFRAEFDGSPPDSSELYWRGPVLWRFDGRTWRRLRDRGQGPARRPSVGPDALSYSVQLEPHERRWLFALDHPVRAPEDARLTRDFEIIREQPVTTLLSYDVISRPGFVDMPSLPPALRQVALALPDDSNPRTRRFARELRDRYADDRELIDAVLQWFNTEPFFYSLDAAPLGRNGADEFLFELRTGYCEYYASAFAVLMRAAGIPARIVTGYQGGLWQTGSDYMLIRHSDAHAWTEVWLQGSGWTRVDPTAAVSPARISGGARSALPGERGWLDAEWIFAMRNQFDRLQHVWNQWVLGFDRDRQGRMLDGVGLGDLAYEARAVILIAIAALAIVPLTLLLQLIAARPRSTDELERAWLRIRRRLARVHIVPVAGETPLELAARAAPELGNGHELLTLAREYVALRYGPSAPAVDRDRFRRRARAWRPKREPGPQSNGPMNVHPTRTTG
jgi:transglutaminase-like putative cysteine protease